MRRVSQHTFCYEAVEEVAGSHDGPVEWVIFYSGLRPSGVLIDMALEKELRPRIPTSRCGLSASPSPRSRSQNMNYRPSRTSPATSARFMLRARVEAEAMPAHILREMLGERIEDLLPPRALEVARQAEEAERGAINLVALAAEREDDC